MQDINNPDQASDYRPRRGREPYNPNTVESVGMMQMVKRCFTKYADFSGRARRSEYWYFALFNFLIIMPLYIMVIILAASESEAVLFPLALMLLYSLATFIPTVAVVVRRLHDTGRSGWNYFIGLIPLVGGIIVIVFLCEDSKPGVNQWGPNPKGIANGDFDANAFRDQEGF